MDVDLTELRRHALGPLSSLSLEPVPPVPPAPSGHAVSCNPPPERGATGAVSTPLSRTDDISPKIQPQCWRVGDSLPSSKTVVQPATRRGVVGTGLSAGATTSCLGITLPGNGSGDGPQLRRRLPWSPSTSPVMSQLKKEGFTVHDVADTVGSGFYPEPPPRSALGDAIEPGRRDAEARLDAGNWKCLDTSEPAVFATAPQAPFFISFVLDEVQQVSHQSILRNLTLSRDGASYG